MKGMEKKQVWAGIGRRGKSEKLANKHRTLIYMLFPFNFCDLEKGLFYLLVGFLCVFFWLWGFVFFLSFLMCANMLPKL